MKKGIFAQRKLNSNLGVENSVDKRSVSVKKPWQNDGFNQGKVNAKADDLRVEKQRSQADDSIISYFYQVNDDYDRLMKRMDCVPNELATFIDNELKLTEDKNASAQRELSEKIDDLRDNVIKVNWSTLHYRIGTLSTFITSGQKFTDRFVYRLKSP